MSIGGTLISIISYLYPTVISEEASEKKLLRRLRVGIFIIVKQSRKLESILGIKKKEGNIALETIMLELRVLRYACAA